MKKKPVAQAEHQRYLLENPLVYGLLSRLRIAIVVTVLHLLIKIEVRYV
ncbi:acid stress response protein YqgB [Salmonella enterica]|nr:acid stress response protein YqgB [Salmonella enterica]